VKAKNSGSNIEARAQREQTSWLRCFGVGDGQASADRKYSSYLYRLGGSALLVDCGEPLSQSYKASGFSYDLFDRLLLSHMHFDHVGGFFMFMQSLWLERRTKPLVVHAPAGGIGPLRQMLQAACIFDEILPFPLRFVPWESGEPVGFDDVRVTPFATSHLAWFRERFEGKYPGNYAAFCFRIEAAGLRIGHSADLGKVEDLVPLAETPLDLLVCELAHLEPQAVFELLRGRDIKRVAFVHLARPQLDSLKTLQARAAEMLHPIQTVFPRDGEDLPL
jgi:ribonuclease Z